MRAAVAPGFWAEVIRRLPRIGQEIHQGKTSEEKLRIANKEISPLFQIWSYTPIGTLSAELANITAQGLVTSQGLRIFVYTICNKTSFGIIVELMCPKKEVQVIVPKYHLHAAPEFLPPPDDEELRRGEEAMKRKEAQKIIKAWDLQQDAEQVRWMRGEALRYTETEERELNIKVALLKSPQDLQQAAKGKLQREGNL
ncbi:hypothetical protein CDD81_5214 [Ophiocordyceps australis]|uniref:Uncharacterized protein n=1 Tax=Ophiocordyceps australis TaxID=1399860 RepID=A0A2C5YHU5_9HYPO|nr:hypothetical protein CDD81_5214 [Ophiocordyceps australis]